MSRIKTSLKLLKEKLKGLKNIKIKKGKKQKARFSAWDAKGDVKVKAKEMLKTLQEVEALTYGSILLFFLGIIALYPAFLEIVQKEERNSPSSQVRVAASQAEESISKGIVIPRFSNERNPFFLRNGDPRKSVRDLFTDCGKLYHYLIGEEKEMHTRLDAEVKELKQNRSGKFFASLSDRIHVSGVQGNKEKWEIVIFQHSYAEGDKADISELLSTDAMQMSENSEYIKTLKSAISADIHFFTETLDAFREFASKNRTSCSFQLLRKFNDLRKRINTIPFELQKRAVEINTNSGGHLRFVRVDRHEAELLLDSGMSLLLRY